MTLICPFCKRDLWIEEDEDLTECPFCGERLSETADPSQSKEQAHSEEVDYKELWLQEKKAHKATSHAWLKFVIYSFVLSSFAEVLFVLYGMKTAVVIGVILLSIGLVGKLIKHEIQRKPEERKKSIKQLLWLLVVLFFIVGVPILIYQYREYKRQQLWSRAGAPVFADEDYVHNAKLDF